MRSTIIESTIYYQKNWGDGQQIEIRHHLYAKRTYFLLKRSMDLSVAFLISLLIFPWLFPIIILLIRLDSKGPAFFKQKRVGFLGKVFWCYKFRTMYLNDAADTRQAVKDDPRVTRIGKFLRNTGLDELPQFINILLGDMSIVGPRPPIPYEVEAYELWHRKRLDMKPGLTGLWQVSGRNRLNFEEMVRLDLYYIENWSLLLDLKIILRTLPVMLKGENAY